MTKKTYRIEVDAGYTRSVLRIISAFYTFFSDTALVVAGIVLLRIVVNVENVASTPQSIE